MNIKLYKAGKICSVQGGIYTSGKAHMRSITVSQKCRSVAFETVATFVWLTMALSRCFDVKAVKRLLFVRLSPPRDRGVMSLASAVPAAMVSSFSTIYIL